ncbi:hypothetical protein PENSPDRAFT_672153 [Peniophora sp. CONT]|nr:hypothetical protein PENSPDRAFT_672153 [Peniophora sp. CONT]
MPRHDGKGGLRPFRGLFARSPSVSASPSNNTSFANLMPLVDTASTSPLQGESSFRSDPTMEARTSASSSHSSTFRDDALERDGHTLASLWDAAFHQYLVATGVDLKDHDSDLYRRLYGSSDLQAVLEVLVKAAKDFGLYRHPSADDVCDKIRCALKPIVRVVLSTGVLEVGGELAAGLSVRGGKAPFVAIMVLLRATQGVSARFDAVAALLERFESYMTRLDVRIGATLESASHALVVKILVEMLHTFAIVTQMMRKSRMNHFLSALTGGGSTITDASRRLEILEVQDTRLTLASIYKEVCTLSDSLHDDLSRIEDGVILINEHVEVVSSNITEISVDVRYTQVLTIRVGRSSHRVPRRYHKVSRQDIHGLLLDRFANKKGSEYVKSRAYTITNTAGQSEILKPETWTQTVRAGMILEMSILIRQLRHSLQCPYCGTFPSQETNDDLPIASKVVEADANDDSSQVLISGQLYASSESGRDHSKQDAPSESTVPPGAQPFDSEDADDDVREAALKGIRSHRTEDMTLFRRITVQLMQKSAQGNVLLNLFTNMGTRQHERATTQFVNNMPTVRHEELFGLARQARAIEADLDTRIGETINMVRGGSNSIQMAQQVQELQKQLSLAKILAHKINQEIMVRKDIGQFPVHLLHQLPRPSGDPLPRMLPNGMTNPDWLKAHGAPPDLFTNGAYSQHEVQGAVDRMRHSIMSQSAGLPTLQHVTGVNSGPGVERDGVENGYGSKNDTGAIGASPELVHGSSANASFERGEEPAASGWDWQ